MNLFTVSSKLTFLNFFFYFNSYYQTRVIIVPYRKILRVSENNCKLTYKNHLIYFSQTSSSSTVYTFHCWTMASYQNRSFGLLYSAGLTGWPIGFNFSSTLECRDTRDANSWRHSAFSIHNQRQQSY